MGIRNSAVGLFVAALVLQGLASGLPHDHGASCGDGPSVEPAAAASSPHQCLACSIHAPVAAAVSGVVVVRSETGIVPVGVMVSSHGFSAPVESSDPRGPPRVF